MDGPFGAITGIAVSQCVILMLYIHFISRRLDHNFSTLWIHLLRLVVTLILLSAMAAGIVKYMHLTTWISLGSASFGIGSIIFVTALFIGLSKKSRGSIIMRIVKQFKNITSV